VLYWFVTGTARGLGAAGLPSIGIFHIPIGVILVIFGAIRLGALPAILVHNTISFAEKQPISGPIPPAFYLLQWGFILIAVAGVAWGLVQALVEWRRDALTSSYWAPRAYLSYEQHPSIAPRSAEMWRRSLAPWTPGLCDSLVSARGPS
jgi:hypothetical protein